MKLYLMNMWRFGDCIQIIADNKRNGYSALKEKYYELYYFYNNGEKPTAAEWKETKSDIEIREFRLNKVFNPCE